MKHHRQQSNNNAHFAAARWGGVRPCDQSRESWVAILAARGGRVRSPGHQSPPTAPLLYLLVEVLPWRYFIRSDGNKSMKRGCTEPPAARAYRTRTKRDVSGLWGAWRGCTAAFCRGVGFTPDTTATAVGTAVHGRLREGRQRPLYRAHVIAWHPRRDGRGWGPQQCPGVASGTSVSMFRIFSSG